MTTSSRRRYIDWLRGLAVLLMIGVFQSKDSTTLITWLTVAVMAVAAALTVHGLGWTTNAAGTITAGR